MVGRTPEYLGKKIEAQGDEARDALRAHLPAGHPRLHARGGGRSARACPALNNAGPHGLSEILYAYTQRHGQQRQAFAGLTANTPFYNTTLGLAMLIGPLPDDRPDAGHRRLHGRARRSCPPARAPSPPTARSSWRCWWAWSSSSARSPSSRRSRSGPIVEHFLGRRREAVLTPWLDPQVLETPRSAVRPGAPRSRALARQLCASSHPRHVVRNPVMFVVVVGSLLTTALSGPRPRRAAAGRAAAVVHARGALLALVHRALRQLRRGDGRGPRQGPGRHACAGCARRPTARRLADGASRSACPPPSCARATSSCARRATSSPATAKWSRASPAWTSPPSPASPPRSSASPAATARPSPAAPRCSPTASSSASPRTRARRFLDRMIAPRGRRHPAEDAQRDRAHILLSGLTIVFLLAW